MKGLYEKIIKNLTTPSEQELYYIYLYIKKSND